MQKAFVLDTNVLVHDSESVFQFADNKVIIPMSVIEELDDIKKYRDHIGYNARRAARNIDELRKKGNLLTGVEINEKGLLKVIPEKAGGEWPAGLNKHKKDNLIIKVACDLSETEKKVIFVSKDLNARIKADVLGIEVQNYEKEKVEFKAFAKGWVELSLEPGLIDKFYKEKKLNLDEIKASSDLQLFPNCYFLLKDSASQNKSAIGKYAHKSGEILPLKYDLKPVWGINALNLEQRFVFDLLLDPSVNLVVLVGSAGTGKTLLSIAAGLKQVIEDHLYKKILVSRPIVPLGKDIGYLPGSKDEKLGLWMQPIFDNLYFIINRLNNTKINIDDNKSRKHGAAGTIDHLMETELLELAAVTYIRGRTIPEQYIIIDEAQNLTPHEVKTIISRVGENSKIILTGDPFQIDNPYLDTESNGLIYVAEQFKNQEIAAHIVLSRSERSPLASLAAELL
jgi:PhoH-like ATPase